LGDYPFTKGLRIDPPPTVAPVASPKDFLKSEDLDSSAYCPFALGEPSRPLDGRGPVARGPRVHAAANRTVGLH
jgi:hypothetical protein